MADELFDTLMRFHREVVQPELQEIRVEVRDMRGEMATLRGEMATRSELQAVRGEMATMRAEMATLTELQAMRAEMVTWPVLMKFFAEMVMPEIENVRSELQALSRSEMLSHVDGIWVELKRLQSEYHALTAGVGRLERQMAEQIADRLEVRSELVDLKAQVSQISDRIAELGRETN